MANIQEKISALCPEATFEEGETLLVTVPDAKWHALAKAMKEDADLSFDYLVGITGVDWKESMGCIYYFTSTKYGTHVSVKVSTTDREKPMLHSVSDLWKVALIHEREVYDFYGIIFINHPDMRRYFLRNDWKGFPLRKDYDASDKANPIRLEAEKNEDDTVSYIEDAEGKIQKKRKLVFKPEEYVINIGPQHPSTHGVMRMRTALEGETITHIDMVTGYIHRGIEKLCEGLGYPQSLLFTDRMDYMSAHQNRHCLCLCIEKALGLEVPKRAQVIRVMMDELMRLSSHLLSYGCLTMDLGATTAFFYGFREREIILNIFEKTCGARMSLNYDTIGGVMADIDVDFANDVKALCKLMPERLKEYHKLFTGNVIANNRLRGVGVLSREDAINLSVTGPSGRGSGWACDVRKTAPYSIYNEIDFDEITETDGDSFARYMVRMREMEQCVKILEQLADNIPEGDYCAKVPKIIKLPVGHWFQQVEASRGAFGVYIESTGEKTPYRMHFNSPCLNLLGAVDPCTRGEKIADLIAINASLDYVVPDVDR
jgi:NADH-quinone oxidoreductase subunit C/D